MKLFKLLTLTSIAFVSNQSFSSEPSRSFSPTIEEKLIALDSITKELQENLIKFYEPSDIQIVLDKIAEARNELLMGQPSTLPVRS